MEFLHSISMWPNFLHFIQNLGKNSKTTYFLNHVSSKSIISISAGILLVESINTSILARPTHDFDKVGVPTAIGLPMNDTIFPKVELFHNSKGRFERFSNTWILKSGVAPNLHLGGRGYKRSGIPNKWNGPIWYPIPIPSTRFHGKRPWIVLAIFSLACRHFLFLGKWHASKPSK